MAGLAGVPALAAAHQLDHPAALRVGVRPDAVVVSLTYDVDPGEPSRLLRGLFDRDADGQLDAAEREKLLKYLEDTARLWLKLEVGGAPVELVRRSREGSRLDLPAAATAALGISLVLTASVAEPAALSRVHLEDRDKDGRKHVPVVVDVAEGLHVRFASRGEWHPDLRQLHRVMLGPDMHLDLSLVRSERNQDGSRGRRSRTSPVHPRHEDVAGPSGARTVPRSAEPDLTRPSAPRGRG